MKQNFRLYFAVLAAGFAIGLCGSFNKEVILYAPTAVYLFFKLAMVVFFLLLGTEFAAYLFYKDFLKSDGEKIREDVKAMGALQYALIKLWWNNRFKARIEKIVKGA